jgi:hypothetical protein
VGGAPNTHGRQKDLHHRSRLHSASLGCGRGLRACRHRGLLIRNGTRSPRTCHICHTCHSCDWIAAAKSPLRWVWVQSLHHRCMCTIHTIILLYSQNTIHASAHALGVPVFCRQISFLVSKWLPVCFHPGLELPQAPRTSPNWLLRQLHRSGEGAQPHVDGVHRHR